MALAATSHAQSNDALLDKLVDKGILSVKEAQELRDESDKGFTQAFQTKTGMPDWVNGYKFSGDVRGRLDWVTGDNETFTDRVRLRYRLRAGVAVSMFDGLEAGFRLGSGDTASGFSTGNPLSNNSTMQDNGTKKAIWVDTAYGKWTFINNANWVVSSTIGKMDNPYRFTPMVFDTDYTPEGAAVNALYRINDKHSIVFNGAAFALDELSTSSQDPFMYGGQVIWDATWSPKIESSLGVSFLNIVNAQSLTSANVPDVNGGNTRNSLGVLVNHYNPIIADASITYKLDSFPLYKGAFPIKLAGEFINNPGAEENNTGFWAGVTFGKSGTKNTWDVSYRYEYLESDAWYEEVVDDDPGALYQSTLAYVSPGGKAGFYGGTNIKGHQVKLNYSITDALTFTFSWYLDNLIKADPTNPNNQAMHVMADLMWKF